MRLFECGMRVLWYFELEWWNRWRGGYCGVCVGVV